MKKFIAIFAFLGILLQTFSQVVIVAQYYAQKDYIAKNLCENRNKPQMHCDGKCCLKKKLAKEGKDQAPSPQNQKNEQVVLFCHDNQTQALSFVTTSTPNHHFVHNDLRTFSFPTSVFHPPAA